MEDAEDEKVSLAAQRLALSNTTTTIMNEIRHHHGKRRSYSPSSSASRESISPSDIYHDFDTPLTPLSPRLSQRYPSDTNKIHRCSYQGCIKSFNRPAKLEQHLRSHTNTRPFVCPHALCAKAFLRDSHLKHHVKSAHSVVRDYHCKWQDCSKSFLTATRLRRHTAAHEGRQQYVCPEDACAESFRKHTTLQTHLAKAHGGTLPYICAFLDANGRRCNAGFLTPARLETHYGRMHDVKRYTCDLCANGVNVKANMDGDSNWTHDFCTYSALQQHIHEIHPPICPHCEQTFSTQATLRTHIEIHHDDRSLDERRIHPCPEQDCEATFTRKGNLNIHRKSVHGTARFVCGVTDVEDYRGIAGWNNTDGCGVSYTSRAKLADHIKLAHLTAKSSTRLLKNKRHTENPRQMGLARLLGNDLTALQVSHSFCIVPDCADRIENEAALLTHLHAQHGLTYREIQEMRAARLLDNTSYENESFMEDPEPCYFIDANSGAEQASWYISSETGREPAHDDWLHDEMEMSQIIP